MSPNRYNRGVITTFAGENNGARSAAVKKTVDAFVAQYTDMGLERLDGEEATFERLVEAVQSLPFLVERKLVIVRGGSLNKDFTERFDEFLAAVTESTDVLLVEGKLDKRTAFYKALQKQTEFKDFALLDENGLVRFAGEYIKSQGGTLNPADARYLVGRTQPDQIGLQNELDKLLAYDPVVSRASIDLLTEAKPQSRIFDLLDAAFADNTTRTLALYGDQRAQGVEPQQIIAMLVWQLYIFALCKAGQRKPASEIAKAAKLSPYVVEKSLAAVRRIPLARLKKFIRSLSQIDVRGKSEGIVLDDALRHYLLSIGSL